MLAMGVVAAAGCSVVAGVDKDYREVEPGGTGGVAGSAGVGGASGGIAGAGGVAGASGGAAGTGATGGVSGSGGTGGTVAKACADLAKECIPAVPAGWNGPVALSTGASAPPACPSSYPTQTSTSPLGIGVQVGAGTCGCSCTPPTDGACPTATLYHHTSTASCTSLALPIVTLTDGAGCKPANLLGTVDWIRAFGNFSSSPCTPVTTPSLPTPTWSMQARACGGASTEGTCPTNQICAPPVTSSMESCVYQAGDSACPTGYTNKQVFYETFDDTRACTGCSCGTATGICKGNLGFHTTDCSIAPAVNLGQCIPPPATSFASYVAGAPTNVSCPPSTASLGGGVTQKNPVTLCCRS